MSRTCYFACALGDWVRLNLYETYPEFPLTECVHCHREHEAHDGQGNCIYDTSEFFPSGDTGGTYARMLISYFGRDMFEIFGDLNVDECTEVFTKAMPWAHGKKIWVPTPAEKEATLEYKKTLESVQIRERMRLSYVVTNDHSVPCWRDEG